MKMFIQRFFFASLFIFSFLRVSPSQNRWEGISSPGPINCASIVIASDSLIIVGMDDYFYNLPSGVLFSSDRGGTWIPRGLPQLNVKGLATGPGNEVYAVANFPPNLYRTTNLGADWTPLNPPVSAPLWSVRVTSESHVFVAGDNGIFRSTDMGVSWEQKNGGIADTVLRRLTVSANNDLYVTSYSGDLYRSTNNGESWADVAPSGESVFSFAEFPPSAILAGTQGLHPLLYRSTNHGQSWTMTDSALIDKRVWDMVVPSPGTIVAVGDSGTFTSTGTGWERFGSPVGGFTRLAVDSGGVVFAVGSSGLSFSSSLGANWQISAGMDNTLVLSLATSPGGVIYAGTNSSAIFRSENNGDTWSILPTSPFVTSTKSMAFSSDGTLYAGSNGIIRSTNGGESWDSLLNVGSSVSYYGIALGDSGLICAATTAGFYCSTDTGATWSLAHASTSKAMLVAPGSAIVLADAQYGQVFRSTNRGASWDAFQVDPQFVSINHLVLAHDGAILAARQDGSVTRSTDGGVTWARWDAGGLPSYVSVLFPVDTGIVLASVPSYGTYRSLDGGVHWSEEGDGIQDPTQVWCFATDSAGNVFAGSAGVARSLPSLTSVGRWDVLPRSTQLHQNFPNPFNPETAISYQIPEVRGQRSEGSHVILKVFDLLGREVATLVNEEQRPGIYRATWDATGFPSGVYFYRLQAGGFVQTRKMILMR